LGNLCVTPSTHKLRGFPLKGKKTPIGVLLFSRQFIPDLKVWVFLTFLNFS